MKILVIEDDRAIIETISLTFRIGWPETEIIAAKLGEEGVELVESQNPDVVILDLGLPDISGFKVLERIRLFSNIPIIVLTQNEDEKSTIKALEYGADDYIIKPFRQLELMARIKTILRRQHSLANTATDSIGPFQFDFSKNSIRYNNRSINLTKTEISILRHLAINQGKIVNNASIAETVWGNDYPDSANAIRVYIRRLRAKLEIDPGQPQLIVTKPGMGYMLTRPV